MANKQRSVVQRSDEARYLDEVVKYLRQQKELDARSPSMTEWDGSTGRSTADNLGMALVAPAAAGMAAPAIPHALKVLLEGTRNKAVIGGSAGAGGGLEAYMNDKATPADIASSAVEWGASTASPVGAMLAQSGDANASKLGDMIRAGKQVFKPSSTDEMVSQLVKRRKTLEKYGITIPDDSALSAALGDSNVTAARVVPSDHWLSAVTPYPSMYRELQGPIKPVIPSIRPVLAETPGWHAAPLENARQLKPIAKRYREEGFTPRAGVIHTKVDTPILMTDLQGEHPDILASAVGASDDLHKFIGSSDFDHSTLPALPQKSKFITDWLAERGVDMGIYDNVVEGVRQGVDNKSRVFFKEPYDLAKGGPVSSAPRNLPNFAIDRSVTDPDAPTRRKVADMADAALTASNFYMPGLGALAKLGAGKLAGLGALGVIKNKGGNWLGGSVEDALRGLKRNTPVLGRDGARTGMYPEAVPEGVLGREGQLNSWIDKQLGNYVRNQMATPEDSIRALAERGVLHYEPRTVYHDSPMQSRNAMRRADAGMSVGETAESPLAKLWEINSDQAVIPRAARDLSSEERAASFGGKTDIDPATRVHQIDYHQLGGPASGDALGFNHLIDELSNAINPSSGLPQHLRFPADRLSKVSVPQAVERVSQINAYRAAKQAEADIAKMKANLLSTKPHKEFDNGWRWAELPGAGNPEGRKLINDIGCQGGWCTQGESAALQYGDHSAGNRLYGLFDPTGRPHVQIHTASPMVKKQLEILRTFAPEEASRYEALMLDENLMRKHRSDMHDLGPDAGERAYFDKYMEDVALEPSELEQLNATAIRQIKPLSNNWDSQMVKDFTAKNPKYREELMPMIQDFVKSGKWSDVGDLDNTGLLQIHPEGGHGRRGSAEHGGVDPGFYTQKELDEAMKSKLSEGFAEGGPIDAFKKLIKHPQPIIPGTETATIAIRGHSDDGWPDYMDTLLEGYQPLTPE